MVLMKYNDIVLDRVMEFEITEEHLRLLQVMYVNWVVFGYDGAPAINEKRPYGNSDVYGDVAEILGWDPLPDWDEDGYEEACEKAKEIHEETWIALQICLVMQSFEPGIYRRKISYDSRSWVKV